MGLRFNDENNDKKTTAPEVNALKEFMEQVDAGGSVEDLDEKAKEAFGQEKFDEAMHVQTLMQNLVDNMKDILRKRRDGLPVSRDMLKQGDELRRAMVGLSPEQIVALVGMGATGMAQFELMIEEIISRKRDDE